jgi:hypothetical protein
MTIAHTSVGVGVGVHVWVWVGEKLHGRDGRERLHGEWKGPTLEGWTQ